MTGISPLEEPPQKRAQVQVNLRAAQPEAVHQGWPVRGKLEVRPLFSLPGLLSFVGLLPPQEPPASLSVFRPSYHSAQRHLLGRRRPGGGEQRKGEAGGSRQHSVTQTQEFW